MNNTKWRKVFHYLINNSVGGCQWQLVSDGDMKYHWPLPRYTDVLEASIQDGVWCPTNYVNIKSLTIPAEYISGRIKGMKPWTKENDLKSIKSEFRKMGKFDIRDNGDSITLYAHQIA